MDELEELKIEPWDLNLTVDAESKYLETLFRTKQRIQEYDDAQKVNHGVKVGVTLIGVLSLLAVLLGIFHATGFVWGLACLVAGAMAHGRENTTLPDLRPELQDAVRLLSQRYKWMGRRFSQVLETRISDTDEIILVQFFMATQTIYGVVDIGILNNPLPTRFDVSWNSILNSWPNSSNRLDEMISESTHRQEFLAGIAPRLPEEFFVHPEPQHQNDQQESVGLSLNKILSNVAAGFQKCFNLGVKALGNIGEHFGRVASAWTGKLGKSGFLAAVGCVGGLVVGVASLALISVLGPVVALIGAVAGVAAVGLCTFFLKALEKAKSVVDNVTDFGEDIILIFEAVKIVVLEHEQPTVKIILEVLALTCVIFLWTVSFVPYDWAPVVCRNGLLLSQALWLGTAMFVLLNKHKLQKYLNNAAKFLQPVLVIMDSLKSNNIDTAMNTLTDVHGAILRFQIPLFIRAIPAIPAVNLLKLVGNIVGESISLVGILTSPDSPTEIPLVQIKRRKFLSQQGFLESVPCHIRKALETAQLYLNKPPVYWYKFILIVSACILAVWLLILIILYQCNIIRHACIVVLFLGLAIVLNQFFVSAGIWVTCTCNSIIENVRKVRSLKNFM